MLCLRCGTNLGDSIYCPRCGLDNSVQKQAMVLSNLYYNAGLEKAQIRDLSGAAEELQRALQFNKKNIQARNLLGLVYFELGEVVAALSEWVISKNMQEENNPASYFIADLQKDAARLDVINQTIKKYNISLKNAREGNEDVAVIQLKKVLAQNPKLIKGYHLLALLYLQKEDYERARKLLRRALKVDQTNTTTLRLLKEVDDKTGKATAVEARLPIFSKRTLADENVPEENPPREGSRLVRIRGVRVPSLRRSSVVWLLAGMLLGAALLGFLAIPSAIRRVNTAANEKITTYSSETAQLRSELRAAQDDKENAQTAKENAEAAARARSRESVSYENLITAWNAYGSEEYEKVALALAEVDPTVLSELPRSIYDMMAPDVRTSLLTHLREKGLAALNSSDYETAVAAFGAAVLLDETDEETNARYIEAQQRLATLNAELRIQNASGSQTAAQQGRESAAVPAQQTGGNASGGNAVIAPSEPGMPSSQSGSSAAPAESAAAPAESSEAPAEEESYEEESFYEEEDYSETYYDEDGDYYDEEENYYDEDTEDE